MGILGDGVTNQSWKPTLIPQQQHRSVDYSETGCVEVTASGGWCKQQRRLEGKHPVPPTLILLVTVPPAVHQQPSSALTLACHGN